VQIDPACFPRARDVEATFAHQDFHLHTALTDGAGSLEDYVAVAHELGHRRMAFSEHADNTSQWLQGKYISHRAALRELAVPMELYLGAEVKACDIHGNIDLADDLIVQLDFIMGVVHRYPRAEGGFHSFASLDPAQAMSVDFAVTKALLANPRVDIWGHPCGVYVQRVAPYDPDLLDELVAIATAMNKIVEINVNPRYANAHRPIIESVLRHNPRVSIGSDSHSPAQFRRSQEVLQSAVGELRARRSSQMAE
jgi:histidinol phosphatase-like PHP family hydrolase